MYKNQYILNDYMDLLNKYNLHFLEEGREDAIIKSNQFYFVESVLDTLISFDLIPTSVFPPIIKVYSWIMKTNMIWISILR